MVIEKQCGLRKNMNKNIVNYIKKYKLSVEKTELDCLVENLKTSSDWTQHYFYDSINNKKIIFDNECEILYFSSKEQKKIQTNLWQFIHQYIMNDIGQMPWFSGWSGYSQIRFNRYSSNQDMKMHCDHIKTLFDGTRNGVPILSIVGLLNNEYKGGEFVMFDDIKIDLSPGEIIIFPSNFLYPHKVTPITEGIRYTFVSWVW
jgi:hypothetical protein